jgi:hypothetical protein
MEALQALQRNFPDIDTPSLILAALYQREGKEAKCTEALANYKQRFPNKSDKIDLTLAQMMLAKKVCLFVCCWHSIVFDFFRAFKFPHFCIHDMFQRLS